VLEARPSNHRLAKARLPGKRDLSLPVEPCGEPSLSPAVLLAQDQPANPWSKGSEKILTYKEIQHMKRRRIFYSVLPVLILLLLIPGGTAIYYLLAHPTTAQVSIRPSAKNVQNLSTLTVVTDHPNVVHHQIVGARWLSATVKQTSGLTHYK
jgi:hypothetical protein